MKLKKLGIALIGCLLMVSLLMGSSVAYAQEGDLPDPGITPDSPFYFLDNIGKGLGMFFSFGPEAKARKALEYAEERLAEAQVMAARNRMSEMERASDSYESFMAAVTERMAEARRQGDNTSDIPESVALAARKHLVVLDGINDHIPEQAQANINRVRTAALEKQKNALRAMASTNPERAFDISQATIEGRLNRAQLKASENVTAEVEAALKDAADLVNIEEEISDIAAGMGTDNSSIARRLAQSTSNRLQVLERIYEKVPETARPAIASALENSLEKYDRVIERLRERSSAPDTDEETAALERIRAELRERLQASTGSQAASGETAVKERAQAEVKERVQASAGETKPEIVQGKTGAQSSNDSTGNSRSVTSANTTRERTETSNNGRQDDSNPSP